MLSYLEELLLLRPSDQNVDTIASSIKALIEKRTAFATKLSAIKDKRQKSMLMAPIAEIKSADLQIEELERADVQADQLIVGLQSVLKVRQTEDAVQSLESRRTAVTAELSDLEQAFVEFYEPLIKEFRKFSELFAPLKSKLERVNFDINQYNRKATTEGSAILEKANLNALDVYFDRLALPEASITIEDRWHTPMALKGEAWIVSRVEPTPQHVLDQIKRQVTAPEPIKSSFNPDADYVSRDLGRRLTSI